MQPTQVPQCSRERSAVRIEEKLAQLETKYDGEFRMVFEAIRDLMAPPAKATPKIGFKGESER